MLKALKSMQKDDILKQHYKNFIFSKEETINEKESNDVYGGVVP